MAQGGGGGGGGGLMEGISQHLPNDGKTYTHTFTGALLPLHCRGYMARLRRAILPPPPPPRLPEHFSKHQASSSVSNFILTTAAGRACLHLAYKSNPVGGGDSSAGHGRQVSSSPALIMP